MISIGLVDDQQLVRAGFAMVIGSQDDLSVSWEASDGAQAIDLASALPVDVILMDVRSPAPMASPPPHRSSLPRRRQR